MTRIRALTFVLLSSALAAQSTWVVNPAGTGNFTSLAAAQAGAAPGDTLILVGTMNAITLTKQLNLVAHLATINGQMQVQSPGPVSISGGQFGQIFVDGTTASLDDVATVLVVENGATLSARACSFHAGAGPHGAVTVDASSRGIFSDCTMQGRDAYALFGVIVGTAAADILGHAEMNACVLTGGDSAPGPLFPWHGGPAIALTGSVDLRDCQLSGDPIYDLVWGTGLVRHENTFTGTPNVSAGVTAVAASLPWMTGQSALPGGNLQVAANAPPSTLVTISASLGMNAPIPTPFGDVWLSPGFLPITAGLTDNSGAFGTAIPVPASVPRGLLVTFQGAVIPLTGGLTAMAPAVLHVL